MFRKRQRTVRSLGERMRANSLQTLNAMTGNSQLSELALGISELHPEVPVESWEEAIELAKKVQGAEGTVAIPLIKREISR